jgi:hypothetical protein
LKSGGLFSPALGIAVLAAATAAHHHPGTQPEGYREERGSTLDTLRGKAAGSMARTAATGLALEAEIPGYLSDRGLPPLEGRVTLTQRGLVFRSVDGLLTTFPLVGRSRHSGEKRWRPAAVSLAYMDEDNGRPVYVFRIDVGVFETDTPGPLLDVVSHPDWLDSLSSGDTSRAAPLVNASDSAAMWRTTRAVASGTYADSLYALFGRPRAPVGLIGRRGRTAGRLGEYIEARDSLALDPGRMIGPAQLRHAMAHELGHRWQARAPGQIEMLWGGVSPIRDPKRYGYADLSEHQAEAIAFAVHFLQTTARPTQAATSALVLLDHYELLVPGTRTMARYLSLQPLYRKHPLRSLLTTGR